jgi:predicted nucleic acid-binding protein
MKPVLLDTGFIVALLDRSENFHKTRAQTVREIEAPLVTCEAVITESCYLLRNLSGASEAVIENITAGIFQVPFSFLETLLVSSKYCENTRTGRSIWRMLV